MFRLFTAIAFVFYGTLSAHAQVGTPQTKAALTTEINSNFPNNNDYAITPQTLRQTTLDMLASWQQYTGVNAQTGTTYTLAASDYGQLVTFNNSSSVAVTLPQASGNGFYPWNVILSNIGAGTVTVTPTTSTINGASSYTLATGHSVVVVSDGTNYQIASATNNGTVTSVGQSFTGGLISVSGSPITTSGTLALSVAGTSGGVPYFSSSSTWASSGALGAGDVVLGGGAGSAPTTSSNLSFGSNTLTVNGATLGASGLQIPTGSYGTTIGWPGAAFTEHTANTIYCGDGTPNDTSCALSLGSLSASTLINTPDGGALNPVGTPDYFFNALFIRSTGSGNSPPATLFNGSGALWAGNYNGRNGLNIQGQGSVGGNTCYGGAGSSLSCAGWGQNYLNEFGWQVWGQQQAANDNQDLMIGMLRASAAPGLDESGFTTGVAQIFFSDYVTAGGIGGPGTGFSITGGSGYVNGTYHGVPLSTASAGQYTGQVFATVVVSGNAVSSVTILPPDQYGDAQLVGYGVGLHVGDTLTTANTNIGGSGSGFHITVTSLINGLAAPQMIGLMPGSTVIWGLGPNSSDPNDLTLRLGATENSGTAWYNSDKVSLALGGSLRFGTGNGSNHYPSSPDGNLVCGENLTDNSGTLALTVCNPVATFDAIGSGSAGGSGYTNGSYTGVTMTSDWSSGSTCIGVTANITVSGGAITAFTLNAPGTGCSVGDRLLPNTGTIGAGSGGYATINTLATTPAPISVSIVGFAQNTWADTQTCTAGQMTVDASYIYVCTATNIVKRAALSSF